MKVQRESLKKTQIEENCNDTFRKSNKALRKKKGGRISVIEDNIKATYTSI